MSTNVGLDLNGKIDRLSDHFEAIYKQSLKNVLEKRADQSGPGTTLSDLTEDREK